VNENPNQPSPSGPEAWGPGGWHPYPGDYWAQPAQHSTAAYPPPPYGTAPSPQKRKQHTFLLAAALVAAGSIAGAAIGHAAWQPAVNLLSNHASRSAQAPSSPDLGSGSSGTGSAALSAAASAISPSIVDINTTLGNSGGQAAGSGIVLTSDGEVLTNNHVIAGATSISATDVGNGRTYKATVVGYDRSHDIAILRLEGASGLKTASIGDSSSLSIGESVVGVGNAGGTGGTPTAAAGVITALNQTITASDEGGGSAQQLTGLIQVDANIQPGDSGGPLVDSKGKVIGIDTAASQGSAFQSNGSEGFAVPINQAVTIAKQIERGQASTTVHIGKTAFLGVQTRGAAQFGSGSGAVIVGVQSGTPADTAGLVAGDVITAVDGKTIDSAATLSASLVTHHPGDTVRIQWVDSSGQQQSANVQLAEGPAA